MKTFKALAFASFIALGLSACGGGGSSSEWQSKYEKIVEEACACTDEACFDQAREKRKTLRNEFKETFKDKKDEAKKVGEKMAPLDEKFSECGDKLRAATPPPVAPPAAPPAAPDTAPAAAPDTAPAAAPDTAPDTAK